LSIDDRLYFGKIVLQVGKYLYILATSAIGYLFKHIKKSSKLRWSKLDTQDVGETTYQV